MSDTPRFAMPLLSASQAQKHVTHNEALVLIDALVNAWIIDRDLNAPPGSPADGDAYIVAAAPTGDWAGQAGKITSLIDGGWRFYTPFRGLVIYVADEQKILIHNGSIWVDYASVLSLQNVPLLGVNTTADATNKLALRSNAALFTALYAADSGNGDFLQKINKEAAGDTASQLYQTNFSGRAETGLTGDDDFHFKVSPDGSSWKDALILDKSSGLAALYGDPTAALHAATKQYVDAGFRILAASAVAASHTGNTLETVLATITVPAGAMGPNGILRITTNWTVTNSANSKTLRCRFGGIAGTLYMSGAFTTVATLRAQTQIQNRNAANAQVGGHSNPSVSFGTTSTAFPTSAIDTASAVDIVLTALLANAGETITLESYLVEIAKRT